MLCCRVLSSHPAKKKRRPDFIKPESASLFVLRPAASALCVRTLTSPVAQCLKRHDRRRRRQFTRHSLCLVSQTACQKATRRGSPDGL